MVGKRGVEDSRKYTHGGVNNSRSPLAAAGGGPAGDGRVTAKKNLGNAHFGVADSGRLFCIIRVLLPLLAVLAANAAPTPQVEIRAMSFDEPNVRVFLVEGDPANPAKSEAQPLDLYSHALTHAVRVRCPEARLSFHRQATDAEGKTVYLPLASVAVPPEGGTFLAILHGSAGQFGLSLVADTGAHGAGGTLRFFNLCPTPVAMDFPGLRQVVGPSKQVLLRPPVKPEDYGQGRFFLPEGEEWRPAGGLRWLQLEDVRTLWFILPAPGQPGIVTLRGIEERIPTPGEPAANGAKPAAGNGAANGSGNGSARVR